MQFIYHENSGEDLIELNDETFRHLFKSRRENANENKFFRNLKDDYLYEYQVENISKKSASFRLVGQKENKSFSKKDINIGWCIIDNKSIDKTLPFLNELGVKKISFVYCKRSQKKYKIDIDRINKILINSCCQCNRTNLMQIEVLNSIEEYLKLYPNSYMLNFTEQTMDDIGLDKIENILIGCEGGFNLEEIEKFDTKKIVGINVKNILKSETAIVTVASKLLG
jgi:16S rRNA (uracil1498-N3)-methyltransferase